MQFYFEQIYVIEGIQPWCTDINVDYSIENDLQQYLWPLRIIVKAKLSSCDNMTEQHFIPLNYDHLTYFITIAVLTGVFCATSCIFHFIRLLAFFKLAKVSPINYIYLQYSCALL